MSVNECSTDQCHEVRKSDHKHSSHFVEHSPVSTSRQEKIDLNALHAHVRFYLPGAFVILLACNGFCLFFSREGIENLRLSLTRLEIYELCEQSEVSIQKFPAAFLVRERVNLFITGYIIILERNIFLFLKLYYKRL